MILIINNISAQNIIVFQNDTLVTFTKDKVEVLNEIALHRKYLIQELQLCDSVGMIKDSILWARNKEIEKYKSISKISDAKILLYGNRISELEKQIKKKNREKNLIFGGGILAFIMGVLFL